MRIVVLVKEVPDTYGDRKIDVETGLVDRSASDRVSDEIGDRAVEAALTLQEAIADTTVTVISMGPATVPETLRKALAMGADAAVHIIDDALVGADLTLTAEVLAAAVRREEADLVLTGNLSTDGNGGVIAAMLAELLGFAQITDLAVVEGDAAMIRGTRATEFGTAEVEAALPAVASVTEALPDPRFASFKGIMSAKRKPLTTVSASELAVDPADESTARAIVIAAAERPARAAGVKIVDEGDAGRQLAAFLIEQKLA